MCSWVIFFFSSRRRHTRCGRDWSSDVCSSDLAERHRPEVALVDVRMPGGGGARVARELRDRSADTRVIAVSSGEERQAILRLLAAGVAGYLVRGAPPEEFLRAIRESVEGRATFSRRSSPPSSKRSAAISK